MTRALLLPGLLLAEAAARSIASAHGEIRGVVARLASTHVHAIATLSAAGLITIILLSTSPTIWPFGIGYVVLTAILALCDHAWRCVPAIPLLLFAVTGAIFAITHVPIEAVAVNIGLNAGVIAAVALAVNLLFREIRFRRTGRRPPRRTAMSGIAIGDIYLISAVALWLPEDSSAVFWMTACIATLAYALLRRAHTIRGAIPILTAGFVALVLGPESDTYISQPLASAILAVLA